MFSAIKMSSKPNDYANLSMSEKLQKILVEGTKDVKFIFELNDDNNTNNGPSASKYARYSVDSGNVVVILAHKKMLAASSPVFNAMFNGALKESGDIKITDVSPDAFREFLRIFYNDRVELTTENLDEVMKLIDKYDVDAGWTVVETFFEESLPDVDMLWGLHLAVKFRRDNLIAHCRNTIKQNIPKLCNMIEIDDSCKPKFRPSANNRPMTDADLANIFPLIWRSFIQMAGIVKVKLHQSVGMIHSIDQVEDVSFFSYSKVLLTHLKYPAIYTYNQKRQLKSRPYDVEVTIDGTESYHKIPWNGGSIKLSTPVLIQPNLKYTIQTKIIVNFASKPFFEVYRTPTGVVRLSSNIQLQFDVTHYSCLAAMNFVRCDE